MRFLILTILYGATLFPLCAQVPQPDSLRLWFDVEIIDSLREITFLPKVWNRSASPGYFYYQFRQTDASLRPGNVVVKETGVVFVPPFDTTTLLRTVLRFQPEQDFNVLLYLLDEEFVVADTFWNFEEQYALWKNPKTTGKPKKQVFLAKDDFEIDGLIFNETRTPFGREFHRQFLELWQPPKGASGFWITIRETLTPGRYTLISVSLNSRELFQRYLLPRQEFIIELARQSVDYVSSLLQKGNYDGSLTGEDLFGKGVEVKPTEKF